MTASRLRRHRPGAAGGVFAFGLAGMSLMGLPPSGGFVAKAMLLTASVSEGQWWWAVVIMIGGLLAAGYMFRVLAPALAGGAAPLILARPHLAAAPGDRAWRWRSARCCWG